MVSTSRTSHDDHEQVHTVLLARERAIRDKDVLASSSVYVPDVTVFALAPPLSLRGQAAFDEAGTRAWYDSFTGPIGRQRRDLVVEVSGDIACAHCLVHLTGRRTDGAETDLWFRETLVLRRHGDTWLISHEHASVPLLMDGSGAAATQLHP
ncbi:YybH family protein [Actinoalloteichus caeruleus]|uniref:YybH family protein n=1 Tax=Actinoalloteichus cyanogriseus TaxID=2893586 RepID=UPI003AB10851